MCWKQSMWWAIVSLYKRCQTLIKLERLKLAIETPSQHPIQTSFEPIKTQKIGSGCFFVLFFSIDRTGHRSWGLYWISIVDICFECLTGCQVKWVLTLQLLRASFSSVWSLSEFWREVKKAIMHLLSNHIVGQAPLRWPLGSKSRIDGRVL